MQKSTEDQSQKIVELQLQIDKLIKQLYGQKSERSVDDPNQLTLNFGDDEQSKDAMADAVLKRKRSCRNSRSGVRSPNRKSHATSSFRRIWNVMK